MLSCFISESSRAAIPIHVLTSQTYAEWLATQTDATKEWLKTTCFKPEAGTLRVIPDPSGKLSQVVCAVADTASFWSVGHLPYILPEGLYSFAQSHSQDREYALAWGLGAYQFTRYKKPVREAAQLKLANDIAIEVNDILASLYLVRDWINTPADDMGPSQLAEAAEKIATQYQAQFTEIVGNELLEENYPCIYTVGRASDDAPRLIDMRWGDTQHPKVTLVGKGVCFDTGGLDLKTSPYMLLMKKDMGGAAHVFGLARMIMAAKLPICLRVLVPAVENAVSGNAYRPGDIIKSRKGLTIEVGNTDAEGRLVLADALTEAVSENPDLLIDISTLTGAARVALGTDLPVVFSNQDELINEVIDHADSEKDPMWRLPLYMPYRELLNSQIADINNNASESYGGAITAALFLKEFVPDHIPWLHFDLMAWNLRTRPGRPQGGEAMGLRALYSYLKARFSKD